MRWHGLISVLGSAVVLATGCVDVAAEQQGESIVRFTFEESGALAVWEGTGEPEIRLDTASDGTRSLRVERVTAEGAGTRTVRTRLPLDRLCGSRVRVEARVKAEGVAPPPNPWNGIECMLHTVSPDGSRWQQQNHVHGTFDWKPVRFVAEVPRNAQEAWLVLGLEQTTGLVWFDEVQVTVIGRRRSVPAERPSGPVYKGHDLPRLRGAMIGPRVGAEDLRLLGGPWKANHVRWQLIWGGFPRSPADRASIEEYDHWLDSELDRLERLLPVCEEVGLHVLIDLHTPPGGRNDANECRIFHERRFQDAFLSAWDRIATRFREKRIVWGYDLVNEPVEGLVTDGLMDWHTLATVTARKIRHIDSQHAIVVEPSPWGGPDALEWFEPLDVPGVVYSVHMYQPHRFTHQGIHGNPEGVRYPAEVDGVLWNRERLLRALQPAIDYQKDYGVHMYLGEFSAIRWAPGDSACNYLRDCIEIFEQQGWDWAYHAFREWDGWSVEHGPDRQDRSRATTPTDRELLLRSWFSRNAR